MKKIKDEEPNITEDNKLFLEISNQSGETLVVSQSVNESMFFEKTQCQKIKKKLLNIPFSIYFLILIILLTILLVSYYIYYYETTKPNFKRGKPEFDPGFLNDREYENYLFDNGLEVMLIYDKTFERDGGAILIEKGYYDNPYEEGLSTFASSLLSILKFKEPDNIPILEDYFGNFKYGTDNIYMNFRFDILNNGFKKFLRDFAPILDFKNISEDSFNRAKDVSFVEMINEISIKKRDIYYRENHLVEYLVYGFKNESNGEILPEGNPEIINKLNVTQITNYIKNLINPSKIKIVLFSKYKFLISSKYMKNFFKYLTNMPKFTDKISNTTLKNEKNVFNTSQIFYIRANEYELNYLKIIYYINKVGNESFSELCHKKRYLFYISDFLKKVKNGTLYSSFKSKIKNIYIENPEVILKSKIRFSIIIELNNLENINDIIYATYQYIYKIISETNEKGIQMDRYSELYEICNNYDSLTEKSYDTIELAKNNAKRLIESAYNQKDFYPYYCVPSDYEFNSKKYFNEMIPYLRQLTPNNSVIILSIRDKDKVKLTCNKESKFYLNCDYFKNDSNIQNTSYYDVYYINDIFNSTKIDEYLIEDKDKDNFNITFEKNKFKSIYKYPINETEEEKEIKKIDYKNTLNNFYFKRNINFRVPRLLIKFNLYHPYLRQNKDTAENEKKCKYFLIMEMFSAIKRKINEELNDALLSFTEINFAQSEDHLDILVFCFSDQAYNIAEAMKNIIYDTDWTLSDFFTNNEIYKNEAFDDYFIFDKFDIIEISRNYFNSQLKHNLHNKYEFFFDDFEKNYYKECINNAKTKHNILKDLLTFIIDISIYGFYTEEQALKIYDLFNFNNSYDFSVILDELNIPVSANNYSQWLKEIIQLENNEKNEINITINENIYNKYENGNIGISYRIFKDESPLDISILQTIIEKLGKTENYDLISYDIFKKRNYTVELVFFSLYDDSIIPNENLVNHTWNELLKNYKELNHQVDKIGDRLYYLMKNFILFLDKKQKKLFDQGLSEINECDYNGTVIDPYKIISEYNRRYKNGKKFDENDLNNLIENYKKVINNTFRINIFTSGK